MQTERKLYNTLAYLVLIVRRVRQDIESPAMTKYNLEDLESALQKCEKLLIESSQDVAN
jgi:hypothetical protein